MFLSIIGVLLHKYRSYMYAFYFVQLNTFFWEGVRRFHQTLKGGTKKIKSPFLRHVWTVSRGRNPCDFQNKVRSLLSFSTTCLWEMAVSMLTEMSLMTSNITPLRIGMRKWSLHCLKFPCAVASFAERRKNRYYTETTGSGMERLAY